MKIVNPTDTVVLLAVGAGIHFEPGEVKEVPDHVTRARRWRNGSRRPSVMEEYAPQLRPADEDDFAAWKLTPEYGTTRKDPKTPNYLELVKSGIAPAVARIMVEAGLQAQRQQLDKDIAALEAKENAKVLKRVAKANKAE